MKLIDILIKTVNGEEIPDKFIYEKTVFTKENNGGYTDEDGDNLIDRISTDYSNLNDEVEIIQENKNIDYVNTYILCDSDFKEKGNFSYKSTEIIDKAFEEYSVAINKIIDKLEEIK